MRCRTYLGNSVDLGRLQAIPLHQIPNLQMISARDAGHRVEPQILPPPFDHLVILVFHAAQRRRLFLRQGVPMAQFAESFSEEFGGGKVVRHSRRLRIARPREHRSIKYPCIGSNPPLNSPRL